MFLAELQSFFIIYGNGLMKKIIGLAVASSVLLSGCASTSLENSLSSVSSALNPLADFETLDADVNSGNTQHALQLATKNAGLDEQKHQLDDQLWGMQTASLHRMQKHYEQSNHYFDLIEDVMYLEDTENLLEQGAEAVGSTITNDTYLDYEQKLFDSVMINTYKALNFTILGDLPSARVEWNRSYDRQRRAADYFAKKINAKKQKQRQESEKELAKENGNSGNIDKSLSQSEEVLAQQGIDMSQWSAYQGYINPFSTYMHGLFFMLNAQDRSDLDKAIDSLTRVDGITHSAVAHESLAIAKDLRRGKRKANHLNKVWVIFENSQVAKKEEFRVDLPLFLVSDDVVYSGIALPKLEEQVDYFDHLDVQGKRTEVIADMDKIVQSEFKEEFPLILAKELTRATLKTVLQKQANDKSRLLGLAAGMLQAASTKADTRTWSLLPKNFQAALVDLPKNHKLTINCNGFSQPLDVEIDSDNGAIVYVKALSPSIAPSVEVISL